jgi:hypothetical protein
MDRPPPDPAKLLDQWMEWERGEATPGRVMANLKTAGLRDLLEAAIAARLEMAAAEAGANEALTDDELIGDEATAWQPSV